MIPSISHDREEESPEAKARWFQSLSMDERAVLFNDMYEMIVAANPKILETKDARPPRKGLQIISLP